MVENSHNHIGYSLPSELLTDQLPTEFPYDFASFTSPTEDDEGDFFTGLTRQFALSTLLDSNKLKYAASQTQRKWSLSSSPQSTPSPVFSNGSPTGPFQGPSSPTGPFAPTDYSWDLIREAAGQVNMLNKLKAQQALKTNRDLLCLASNFTHPHSSKPHPCFYSENHLKTNCGSIWAGPHACQKRPQFGVQNTCGFGGNVMCGNPHSLCNLNGFVGDHSSLFSGGRKNVPGGGVKKKCAGTGVFLPRTCPDPVEYRAKSGCSPGLAQQRAAEAMINMKNDNLMMHPAEAQPRFLDGVTPNHEEMRMRRNAVLAQQWRNGVEMMAAANKAMNYDMHHHLPPEW
ncbi:hypothetical protein POM88_040498 [Heracleum sosnowskyi]|uniref:Uncharacterized protein n=1 Tax=Heracleum sosnowskyi TaxID=360622 RepID=A0AAD8M9W6_9APIA|nr:hypothetical protein POM88_040498 [Heracleum sosnowskyi]